MWSSVITLNMSILVSLLRTVSGFWWEVVDTSHKPVSEFLAPLYERCSSSNSAPLPKNDVKSWVGYRNQIKHPASSVTKPLSFTRADLVWLEPFLRFFPSLVGHFQMHNLGR